ncbi:hypothetical protein [Planomonospora sp. ID82291]|uniref:hypothetical protein n=1 Tax=Planomonospora sp. ID82291 TaxID=2738136 RepID=UPI0018C418E9|nr:hypothetical protein [Planomonospora sp. ID82291]MBG0818304.1 hypothetical protein [Planomonospora sp. ID82291]
MTSTPTPAVPTAGAMAELTGRRAELETLLRYGSWRGLDDPGHEHAGVLARLRQALADSAPAAHTTRTTHSWNRSRRINRRGALVYGDESFAECRCGWLRHEVTRALARGLARAHRKEATRLLVPAGDVAAIAELLDPYGLDRPRRTYTGWTDDVSLPSVFQASRYIVEAPIVAVEPLPSADASLPRVLLTLAHPERPSNRAARLHVTTVDLRYEPDPRFAPRVIAGLPPLPPWSNLRSHTDPVRVAWLAEQERAAAQ